MPSSGTSLSLQSHLQVTRMVRSLRFGNVDFHASPISNQLAVEIVNPPPMNSPLLELCSLGGKANPLSIWIGFEIVLAEYRLMERLHTPNFAKRKHQLLTDSTSRSSSHLHYGKRDKRSEELPAFPT